MSEADAREQNPQDEQSAGPTGNNEYVHDVSLDVDAENSDEYIAASDNSGEWSGEEEYLSRHFMRNAQAPTISVTVTPSGDANTESNAAGPSQLSEAPTISVTVTPSGDPNTERNAAGPSQELTRVVNADGNSFALTLSPIKAQSVGVPTGAPIARRAPQFSVTIPPGRPASDIDLSEEEIVAHGQTPPSSENESSSEESEVDVDDDEAPDYPPRRPNFVYGFNEYDEDWFNGWEVIFDKDDEGYTDGLPPFTGERRSLVPGVAPMDYFDFLFKESMWGHIVNNTNEYALRRNERMGQDAVARMDHPDYRRHSRQNKWKPVTEDEMRSFCAHLILLGLVKKPELSDYWSQRELTRTPFFGRFMSRDRFQAILSNFHVADDRLNPAYPNPLHRPLAKLEPFIDMCNTQFKAAFKPGPNISIDEGCCPWRGRLRFRVYNKSKPNKFHIKIFQVSDPQIGYLIHFKVYTGVGSCWRNGISSDDEKNNVTTKTVLTLCNDADVFYKGHCIYMDSYFTSVSLAEELFARDTLCCGTAQHRVGQPKMLGHRNGKVKLKPGQTCALRSGPVLCFKWMQDKRQNGQQRKIPKEVYMLTTKHIAEERFSGKVVYNTGEPVYKPAAIVQYCHEMGGVDLTDQLLQYYDFLRRSCKWWRKLWVHLFNIVILNAYLLNRNYGLRNKLTQTEYRYLIASKLLDYTSVPRPLHQVHVAVQLHGNANVHNAGHWPEKLPVTGPVGRQRTKLRKCKYCYVSARQAARGFRTRNEASTTIVCSLCRVALCVYPCFGKYHIENNLQ